MYAAAQMMCSCARATVPRQAGDSGQCALAAVSEALGLDHRDAVLLRCVNNAVFRFPAERVVVRIVLAPGLSHRAAKVAAVAGWLAEHGVPAVRLVDGIGQPVRAGEHLATVWHEVPRTGPPPTGADLATLLRQVHELPAPPFELPVWEPLADVRARLADAVDLDPADRAFLLRRCDEVESALATVRYELPIGPIHGDAHLGNLIPGPDGPVLCDFDSTCIGPREWDLMAMPVGQLRFARPSQHYSDFVGAYGFDVTRWSGFRTLREPRELKITTGPLVALGSSGRLREEFEHRLRTLRDGQLDAVWRPYQ